MDIDFSKINEIYGVDILYSCQENFDELIENIKLLKRIGIENTYEVVERYPLLFLDDSKEFSQKIEKFIMSLGENYKYILENDMSLWEELL